MHEKMRHTSTPPRIEIDQIEHASKIIDISRLNMLTSDSFDGRLLFCKCLIYLFIFVLSIS